MEKWSLIELEPILWATLKTTLKYISKNGNPVHGAELLVELSMVETYVVKQTDYHVQDRTTDFLCVWCSNTRLM